MFNYYVTALEKMYDCEDPHTFKTMMQQLTEPIRHNKLLLLEL